MTIPVYALVEALVNPTDAAVIVKDPLDRILRLLNVATPLVVDPVSVPESVPEFIESVIVYGPLEASVKDPALSLTVTIILKEFKLFVG